MRLPFPLTLRQDFVAGPSAGNVIVPSFISTYCTLGNSSLSHPSLLGSHGLASGALPATRQFFSPAFFLLPPWLTRSLLCYTKPFVVGPGYSPIQEKLDSHIQEKLVTKIKARQFIDLADLLPENVKAQDSEPQTYLDG